ncbi:MAG: hypothetical protein ACI87E_004902, partial [Mariniblastus sp.]
PANVGIFITFICMAGERISYESKSELHELNDLVSRLYLLVV